MVRLLEKFLVLGVLALLLYPVGAVGDTIDPPNYAASLKAGQSLTVTKRVTIDQGTPTTAKVDAFFLTDSTISMEVPITNLQANLDTILNHLSGLGDVAFGVGEYRDVGQDFVYRLDQDVTPDAGLAKAAINLWSAGGGGDIPEANYYGLQQMAANSTWRADSTRLALWFGDAPSHDPAGPPPGVTQAQAIDALKLQAIRVEGFNYGPDNFGIDYAGQAQAIIDAVGGNLFNGVNPTQIATTIDTAMAAAFANYKTVRLGTGAVPPGLTITVSPPSYAGTYDRTTARTFDFEVTLTATKPGAYRFDLPVLVDGGTMAVEHDTINVAGGIEGVLPLLLN